MNGREGSRVLIVDDDPSVREELRKRFEADNVPEVLTAATAEEALKRVAEMPWQYPSAVILDLVLGDGSDAEGLIRDMRKILPDLQVITTSSLIVPLLPGTYAAFVKPAKFDELRKVTRAALTDVPARKMLAFVVCLLKLERDAEGVTVVDNGTGCLLDLDGTRFLLTASHVADAIATDAQSWVVSGEGQAASLEGCAILDSNAKLDLATITLPPNFDPATVGRRFYEPSTWPPERATVSEIAMFIGFPGERRRQVGRDVTMRGVVLAEFVASSSERHFVLAAEIDREVVEGIPESALERTGGVSGAPVFLSRDTGLVLAGVIKEGSDGKNATYLVAHADFITRNGTINAPE